jgi:hypothetical protein
MSFIHINPGGRPYAKNTHTPRRPGHYVPPKRLVRQIFFVTSSAYGSVSSGSVQPHGRVVAFDGPTQATCLSRVEVCDGVIVTSDGGWYRQ